MPPRLAADDAVKEDIMARALTWMLVAVTAGFALFAGGGAFAQNRFALVIGNSKYQAVPALPNPARDAAAVSSFLKAAGFDVTTALDLDQADMRRAVDDFAQRVAGQADEKTVALLYFAGHGVQVDGENYLVPIDARIKSESDVALAAVRFSDIMDTLEQIGHKTRLIFLDACRDNPFSDGKTPRGLAIVSAPTGSLVVYSTSPGATAEDGSGANSPFTEALLSAGRAPDRPIEDTIKAMRVAVNKETVGRQIPWDVSSLVEPFSFFPGAGAGGPLGASMSGPSGAGASGPAVAVSSAAPAGGPSASGPSSTTTAGGSPVSGLSGAIASGTPPSGPSLPPPPEQSAAVWRTKLKAVPADQAYDIAIREDRIVVYQVVLELYPQAAFAVELRDILTRRIEMWAWFDAVGINTVGGYDAFLRLYPNDDLTASAMRLRERARLRSLAANEAPGVLPQPPAGSSGSAGAPAIQTVTKEVPVVQTVEKVVTVPGACGCGVPGPVGPGPIRRGPVVVRPAPGFGAGVGFGRRRF
jgi:Caspase domain